MKKNLKKKLEGFFLIFFILSPFSLSPSLPVRWAMGGYRHKLSSLRFDNFGRGTTDKYGAA